jgi:hypothetical protein
MSNDSGVLGQLGWAEGPEEVNAAANHSVDYRPQWSGKRPGTSEEPAMPSAVSPLNPATVDQPPRAVRSTFIARMAGYRMDHARSD